MNIIETRNRLVQSRIEAGVSQCEIAKRMNCSQALVSRFELLDSVGWKSLTDYAAALGITLDIVIKEKS